jgi:hypothetical protein
MKSVGSGSKAKGSSFERSVCRSLSLWLSDGERDDLLWRSSMSGGRATVQLAKGRVNLSQSGDVSAIGQGAYEFCERTFVEIKHYRALQIDRWMLCGTGNLAKFWSRAVEEADKYGKRPLLVVRQNYYPTLAITDASADVFDGMPRIVLSGCRIAHVRIFEDAIR